MFTEKVAKEASAYTVIMDEEEEACANTDNQDGKAIGNLQDSIKPKNEANDEIEEPVDDEEIYEESSVDPKDLDA